jgi:hypothetical protein
MMKKVLLSLGFAGLAMAEQPPPEKAKAAAAKPAQVDADAVKRARGGTTQTPPDGTIKATGSSGKAELTVKFKNGTATDLDGPKREAGKIEVGKTEPGKIEPGKIESSKTAVKVDGRGIAADKKDIRTTTTAIKGNAAPVQQNNTVK